MGISGNSWDAKDVTQNDECGFSADAGQFDEFFQCAGDLAVVVLYECLEQDPAVRGPCFI